MSTTLSFLNHIILLKALFHVLYDNNQDVYWNIIISLFFIFSYWKDSFFIPLIPSIYLLKWDFAPLEILNIIYILCIIKLFLNYFYYSYYSNYVTFFSYLIVILFLLSKFIILYTLIFLQFFILLTLLMPKRGFEPPQRKFLY